MRTTRASVTSEVVTIFINLINDMLKILVIHPEESSQCSELDI